MAESQKKRFVVTQWAVFEEEIYAVSEEEARKQMDRLTPRFVSMGEYTKAYKEVEERCPRCQKLVDKYDHEDEYTECPYCGIPFETKSTDSSTQTTNEGENE